MIPKQIEHQLLAPHTAVIKEPVGGGLSGARVWKCRTRHGPGCLRAWPPGHPRPDRLRAIHAAMAQARGAGLGFVPALYSTADGQTLAYADGTCWELTEWRPGAADYLQNPSQQRLAAAMTALAALHRVWGEQWQIGPSPAIAERLGRLQFWTEAAGQPPIIAPSERQQRLVRLTIDHLAALGPSWLAQLDSLRAQPVRLHPVLRDIWSAHVLYSGVQVTGIIDYGALRVDEPATDVARLLGSLEPYDQSAWRAGWEVYRGSMPEEACPEEQRVRLLDRVGTLLSAAQWMQWLVIEQRQFPAPLSRLLERWEMFLERLESWRRPPESGLWLGGERR